MKTRIILILALFSATFANAQLDKGSRFFGIQTNLTEGNLYYTSIDLSIDEDRSSLGINLVPAYGWIIENNWMVGAQATVGYSKDAYKGTGLNDPKEFDNYFDLGIAPFTRYYINISKSGKYKIFGMASIELSHAVHRSYRRATSWFPEKDNTSKYTSLDGSVGVGVAYFGRAGSIDMNLSNNGLRLGFYKVLNKIKR